MGALQTLRRKAITVARLRADFADADLGHNALDRALPGSQLTLLAATFCSPDRQRILDSVRLLVQLMREVAPPLAASQGLDYPLGLEGAVAKRFPEFFN